MAVVFWDLGGIMENIYFMKKFTKKKENFVCEHCGRAVEGTGYTNHCPKCLWSKHVDVNPGDRLEKCDDLMKPVDLYKEGQNWILVHRCEKCGIIKRNRISTGDDFDEVIRLSQEIADRKTKNNCHGGGFTIDSG
ncbi:MAG: hypothetical protein A3B89_04870 [Candidatus Buchananbacteria bacterium RIFCSPHIGHO2_02_FULL_40_13]|nr:MAG: hypothetical protein A3B89_04870 [Candidatus Buchananbacteria bacterium RIFCSPHIGHO2_02_FULL_40_13]